MTPLGCYYYYLRFTERKWSHGEIPQLAQSGTLMPPRFTPRQCDPRTCTCNWLPHSNGTVWRETFQTLMDFQMLLEWYYLPLLPTLSLAPRQSSPERSVLTMPVFCRCGNRPKVRRWPKQGHVAHNKWGRESRTPDSGPSTPNPKANSIHLLSPPKWPHHQKKDSREGQRRWAGMEVAPAVHLSGALHPASNRRLSPSR